MSAEILSGVVNTTMPAVGLASAIAHRTGVLGGGKNLAETLGKTLSHHQVVQAVNQPRRANTPLLDVGKAVLSSMGGNPRIAHNAIPRGRFTLPVSHFDRKQIAKSGVEQQLKHSVSVVSKKS